MSTIPVSFKLKDTFAVILFNVFIYLEIFTQSR